MPIKGARGYEERDASAIGIFAVIVLLAIGGLTIHIILVGVINTLKEHKMTTDGWRPVRPGLSGERYSGAGLPGSTNGEAPAAAGQPEYPVLQVSPSGDLKDFRAREEQELNSYGWVNKTTGVVRLPVERAMEIVLRQGLPQRKETARTATGPSNLQLQQQRPSENSVRDQP